jgi:hypothetical protein
MLRSEMDVMVTEGVWVMATSGVGGDRHETIREPDHGVQVPSDKDWDEDDVKQDIRGKG